MTVHLHDLHVRTLGEGRHPSPFSERLADKQTSPHFVHEDDRVMLDDTISVVGATPAADLPSFETAGPRRRIYFDPAVTTAGIVSCGGLCPGVNNVIRGVVQELTVHYRVRRILGFRNGLRGLTRKYRHDTIDLTQSGAEITRSGGTILGSSRGDQDADEMVDTLVARDVDILFVIGGDGSIRAAMRIVDAITRRGLDIAVIAIPKTIDNDLPYTDQSFGFQSAFERATDFIDAVAIEAAAHEHGVGIVKLMGRHSGFIACYAALADPGADMVLIPEVPFDLEGEDGLLARVEHHVMTRGHVVIVVAEGAGQDLLEAAGRLDADGATDASGNLRLGDIGQFLTDSIRAHLTRVGLQPTLRYIDPSYSIRSVTANAYDSVYCLRLAHAAVHAAMAGRTETVVVRWRRRFVHVPMPLITSHRNRVDPDGDLWMSVLEATNQPETLAGRGPARPAPTAP
ncbi:ATP-dependent 6-phosphofructokinase [Actinomycetospora chlora]|uniref:ATP-dependent 6-phosphofructokinase n=1 Tax=Actinomycetospora chlora TaxID=663608 RepID=A0ABP9A9B7_9PSEU